MGKTLKLADIYEPIRHNLAEVENRLQGLSQVDQPYLAELLSYSFQGGGKRLRPALAFFSGKLYDNNLEQLMLLAMSVEVMHMATLVHDDAIDKSAMRWGRPTIYQNWGEEQAVLLGDYLFARAGMLTAETGNIRVIKLLSKTLMIISSGEVAQASSAFNLQQKREQYYNRIYQKTASLFTFAMESGAVLGQSPEESIGILCDYSKNFGIAFQIVDDILDFIGSEEETGKPVGSDMAQGTLTLPALLLLEQYPDDNPVTKVFGGEDRAENIKRVVEAVRNSSIIDDCYQIAADFCRKACKGLNLLPDKPERQALMDLADYIITRRR